MRMLPTIEVRWFIKSKAPDEVVTWFQLGELKPEAQNALVDHYLQLAPIDTLSVELREGRVEVEQRSADRGIMYASAMRGR